MSVKKRPFKAESMVIPDHIRILIRPVLSRLGTDDRVVCQWLSTLALSSHLQALSALSSLARWSAQGRWEATPCGQRPDLEAFGTYLGETFAAPTRKLYLSRVACFLRFLQWRREHDGSALPPSAVVTGTSDALSRVCARLDIDTAAAELWATRRQRRFSHTTALRMLNRFSEWFLDAKKDAAPTTRDVEEWTAALGATYSYSHTRLHRKVVMAWFTWLRDSGHIA